MQKRIATTEQTVPVHAQRAKFMHGPHPKFLHQMLTIKLKIHNQEFLWQANAPVTCAEMRHQVLAANFRQLGFGFRAKSFL